jgi:nicotinamidase-related amidase
MAPLGTPTSNFITTNSPRRHAPSTSLPIDYRADGSSSARRETPSRAKGQARAGWAYDAGMPLDPAVVDPSHTAIVLNEIQRGTVGDRSFLPELVEAAAPMITEVARLVQAGRAAGVEIVHCVAASRVDLKGSMGNTVFAAKAKKAALTTPRDPVELAEFAEVVPEIGVEPGDLVMSRLHSMAPMTDTGLDIVLRNMGITTIIAGGVSLNLGVMGLVIEAASRSYNVVVPRDATVGVPPEYGEMILQNSLSILARISSVQELIDIWSS